MGTGNSTNATLLLIRAFVTYNVPDFSVRLLLCRLLIVILHMKDHKDIIDEDIEASVPEPTRTRKHSAMKDDDIVVLQFDAQKKKTG